MILMLDITQYVCKLMEEYLLITVLAGKILPESKTKLYPERLQFNTIIFRVLDEPAYRSRQI
jgi:hypothetical protein